MIENEPLSMIERLSLEEINMEKYVIEEQEPEAEKESHELSQEAADHEEGSTSTREEHISMANRYPKGTWSWKREARRRTRI